jgi:hypothetical protein
MPDHDDARAVLEALAFGTDARLTPADRLRAIEQLNALDAPARPDDLARMPLDDLERENDSLQAGIIAALFSGSVDVAERYPQTAKLIECEVERRVQARQDVQAMEAEIERLAEEKAGKLADAMYGERMRTPKRSQTAQDGEKAEAEAEESSDTRDAPTSAQKGPGLPDGLTQADLERGWHPLGGRGFPTFEAIRKQRG